MEDSTVGPQLDPTAGYPGTVRGTFDWSETEPTVAVVETVAVATGQSSLDVYELHDVVDTDALNELVTYGREEATGNLQVSLSVAGCEVTVHDDGLVRADVVEEF